MRRRPCRAGDGAVTTAHRHATMDIRAAAENLIRLKNPGAGLRLLLLPLTGCAWLYGTAMRARAWLYRACLLESFGLPCRVIAVGNITVGGTGKTPTVSLLARSLADRGIATCVVSRGYRGARTRAPLVVSDGSRVLADAADAGDEPVMLARRLRGIPVIACSDRVAAGRLACERFGARAVVLDDGFQHLRLRRDLDIVLVNAADPFGNGSLLPRGGLREPLSALGRAGIIVLTKTDAAAGAADLADSLRARCPGAAFYTARYTITALRNTARGDTIQPGRLSGARVAALSSIGDPAGFISMLTGAGMTVCRKLIFPDHHAYGAVDLAEIRRSSGMLDAVVTTEKDIAKLDAGMLQISNLFVMEIEQLIEPSEPFFQEVLSRSGLSEPADA